MSRAAGKGKGERSKGDKSTPNPVVPEVIPGKFTENDWNLVVASNDTQEYINGIVLATVDHTLDIIFKNYLQKQLIPFNVKEAKEAMVQIIEWNFLQPDCGEPAESLASDTWLADVEPASNIIDSWGEGYIPRTAVSPLMSTATTPREIPATIVEDDTMLEVHESELDDNEVQVDDSTIEQTEPESSYDHPEMDEIIQSPPTETKKFRFRPYRGHIKSGKFAALNETLQETEDRLLSVENGSGVKQTKKQQNVFDMPASCLSILKVQSGRPPGNKEVIYDEHGNVVSVIKIQPDKLPNHRVNVGYRVLEPEIEAERARLEALKKGQRVPPKSRRSEGSQKPLTGFSAEGKFISGQVQAPVVQNQDASRLEPLPPSLVDAIDLAPGVSVKEGGVLRNGPMAVPAGNEKFSEIQLKGLRPVHVRAPGQKVHALSASDLLPPEQVAIKPPMSMRQPIPPIQTAH